MKKLQFDNGVQAFSVNGGQVLRFNPSDPNVYHRFVQAQGALEQMERAYQEKAQGQADSAQVLELLHGFDRQVKAQLQEVFGPENDFDRILGGVNLLAVAANGQRVVTNLLEALLPVLEEGIARHDRQKADLAVARAQARRGGR